MSEKAKALLKQGRQDVYAMRLDAAEKAFREAKDLALAGQHRRLYARALGRLQGTLGYRGRMGELWEEVRSATVSAMERGEEGPSTLMLQALFFQFMPPQHEKLPELVRDWVVRASKELLDLDLARSSAQVSIVCSVLGDREAARELQQLALPVLEAELGADHPEVALLLHNLADTQGAIASYTNDAQMEPMFRRAIGIQRARLAPGHPERVIPLFNTAVLLTRKESYAEAEALLLEALRIAMDFEGPNGGTVALVRGALLRLEEATFDPKAEGYLLERLHAANIAQAELGARLAHVCRHYFARGKLAEAEPHYRRMMELAASLAETERAIIVAERGVPGKIYGIMAAGKEALAEKLLLGELAVMEKVLGADHDEPLNQRYFLGNFYRMLGRHSESLKVFQALADARRGIAPADVTRADGLVRLMDAQLYVGDRQAADRTAVEVESLTGKKPVMDPALNEFSRQLRSVWHMLQLRQEPDVIGAALNGDAGAGLVVGLCWAAGQGVKPDFEKARPWLDAAAKAGNPLGVRIAEVLKSGRQVQFDLQLIANAAQAWVAVSQRQ
jgi:tetratricopeptide (TPR) repeat protein